MYQRKKTHTQIYIHYWAILVVASAVPKRYVHVHACIKCSINRLSAGQTHRNCEYSFVKGGMRCDKWARTKHSMENLWYRVEHNMTQLDDNNEKYENVNRHEFQCELKIAHYIVKSMTRCSYFNTGIGFIISFAICNFIHFDRIFYNDFFSLPARLRRFRTKLKEIQLKCETQLQSLLFWAALSAIMEYLTAKFKEENSNQLPTFNTFHRFILHCFEIGLISSVWTIPLKWK